MPEALSRQIVAFVQALRGDRSLQKAPGIAETLDWAAAIVALGRDRAHRGSGRHTLGTLVKSQDDFATARAKTPELIAAGR